MGVGVLLREMRMKPVHIVHNFMGDGELNDLLWDAKIAKDVVDGDFTSLPRRLDVAELVLPLSLPFDVDVFFLHFREKKLPYLAETVF